MDTERKFCVECKHFYRFRAYGMPSFERCLHVECRDVVGRNADPYEARRQDAPCGRNGALFEPKPPRELMWFERILRRVGL